MNCRPYDYKKKEKIIVGLLNNRETLGDQSQLVKTPTYIHSWPSKMLLLLLEQGLQSNVAPLVTDSSALSKLNVWLIFY